MLCLHCLCVCVCVCAFVYVWVCVCACVCVCMCVYVCVCLCACVYVYVHVYVWVSVCLCVCVYVRVWVHACACWYAEDNKENGVRVAIWYIDWCYYIYLLHHLAPWRSPYKDILDPSRVDGARHSWCKCLQVSAIMFATHFKIMMLSINSHTASFIQWISVAW